MQRIVRYIALVLGIVQLSGCATENLWTAQGTNPFPPDATYHVDSPGRERMTQFNGRQMPPPPIRPVEGLSLPNPIQQIAAATATDQSPVAQVNHLEELPWPDKTPLPVVERLPMVGDGGTVVAPLADVASESSTGVPPAEMSQMVDEQSIRRLPQAMDESGVAPGVPVATMTPDVMALPASGDSVPIDFRNALAIATGENPQVAFAGARIREAYAQETAARSLWLPHFRVGASFYNHNGQLQNAAGNVINVDRGAIYAGMGANAAGSGAPRVPGLVSQFELADAIFQPIIARQQYEARMHEAAATTNDVLLSASLAYMELLRAFQLQSIAEMTKQKAADLVKLTGSFAEAGQGPQSDADRAVTELTARSNELEKTFELVDVASARLAQQLSLDGGYKLTPMETTVIPIELIATTDALPMLVETGLRSRNELAGSQRLVDAACAKLRRERASLFLPNVAVAASYGGFGGGTGNNFGGNFSDRFDFDTFAYWNLRNLGVGERAARQQAGAQLDQARAQQLRLMDQITREVSEAYAKVNARRRRIDITKEGIASAENAYDRDVKRIRQGEGLPIEALTSLRALDSARRDYLQSVVDHNQAQFELLRAIGWPGGAGVSLMAE